MTISQINSIIFLLITSPLFSQISLEVNGTLEIELSKGQKDSHFFYNGIHAKYEDWRVAPSEANLVTVLRFNEQWSINNRNIFLRNEGQEFSQFQISQLNLQWNSANRKYQLSIGRFKNPFGLFNNQQLPTDRTFIDRPLPYGFYTNISDRLGYMKGQHLNNTISVENAVDWGTPSNYWAGYSNGIKFSWDLKKDKSLLELAIVNGANNSRTLSFEQLNLGFISRYSYRVNYSLETGFSVSHGSFLLRDNVNQFLPNLFQYSQSMVGADFKLGKRYFEYSGELMFSNYYVPSTKGELKMDGDIRFLKVESLQSLSGYLNVSYEPPFLSGTYLGYQFGYIAFGEDSDGESWDENPMRNTFGVGYDITNFLLLKATYAFQQIRNRGWEQNAFRIGLTGHF